MVDPLDIITVEDIKKLPAFLGRSMFTFRIEKNPEGFFKELQTSPTLQKTLLMDMDLLDMPKYLSRVDLGREASFARWRLEIGK